MINSKRDKIRLAGGTAVAAIAMLYSAQALAQAAAPVEPASSETNIDQSAPGEIIVTALKRSESVNSVGMSISAVSGDQLAKQGITDTSQLVKVVPGFNFTRTGYSTPVYSIRGIGFQEISLGAAPAVSVYVDEVPMPFPVMTDGVALDLERVEVLKGPQGTLFGANSTGGAVNYIAAKPTDTFKAGFNASYGRFNANDLSGFLSGPLSDTLRARLAVQSLHSDGWQKSVTRSDKNGSVNKLQARLLLDWKPVDRLSVAINLNALRDHSESQANQTVAIAPQGLANPLPPGLTNYPLAPANDRAADWNPGRSLHDNNALYQASGRIEYQATDDIKLTSITSFQHYKRYQPIDGDGTSFEDFDVLMTGHVSSFFQELRASGSLMEKLNWIVGANYQSDKIRDLNYFFDADGSARITLGVPFTEGVNNTQTEIKTKALFGDLDFAVTPTLNVQGGMRYTDTGRDFAGCSQDTNGELAAVFTRLSSALRGSPTPAIAQGACGTLNAQTLLPGRFVSSLKENNISWRGAINWKPVTGILLYANVSRGYKAGSFPTLSASVTTQYALVKEESVLAYETGFKLSLLDRTLQLNGAAFYYKYNNKQIRGKLPDAIFGSLPALVNIPKSHVEGFELSAVWHPVKGLTISPAVTMVKSKIEGTFLNYDPLGRLGNFGGEAFPYTPKWSGNVDAEYNFALTSSLDGFLGGNVNHQSSTYGGFGELALVRLKAYSLLDLRAGVQTPDGKWRASIFGHNVTNTYYWTSAAHQQDVILRSTGMPATYGATISYRY